MTATKNIVAYILYGIGILIAIVNLFRALGLTQWIGGQAAFEIFLQGLIIGALFIGFGELIRLLQGLFNQREPEVLAEAAAPERAGGHRVLQEAYEQGLGEETRSRVTEFYMKKGLVVEQMEATPYEGYVMVHRFGKRDIVDLNGFKPEILSDKEVANHPDLRNI